MALKTVSNLKDSIAAILSGIDLSNVDNLYGAIERAARIESQKIDIPEGSYIQNTTLYSGVLDYACDSRIFGTAITDIRPQGISRQPNNFVYKNSQVDFDRNKNYFYPSGTQSTFEYRNGTPIIRIVAPFPKPKDIIDQMNDTTGWVAAGSASNLVQDTVDFYQSPASLRFLLTGASTGTLTKTLSSALDLSDYDDVGVAFLAIEIPNGATAANLTSIQLKLGSSSVNYNSVTNTTGFLGAWTAGQWLLVAFDFSASSETGTADWNAINYVQASFVTAGTITNMRVGGLWLSFPSPAQILFQTAAIFLPSGGSSALTTITADTDQIILSDPAYTILEHEAAIAVCLQTGGTLGSATISTLESALNGARARNGTIINYGLYDLYRADNPSQELRSSGSWYDNDLPYTSSYTSNW